MTETYQEALAAAKRRLDENLAEAAADVVVLAERFGKSIHAVAKDVTADQPELKDSIYRRATRMVEKSRSDVDSGVAEPSEWQRRKAERAKSFLKEPDVVREVVKDPELMASITRAQAEQVEARRTETAKRRAADSVGRGLDGQIALKTLQVEVNTFIQKARALFPEIGVIPEAERFWLEGEADSLEDVAAELRHMADHGATRQELELQRMGKAG